MKDSTFSVGTVVQLRSGGPLLVVHAVTLAGIVCRWFDGRKLKEHCFSPAVLTTEVK